MTEQVSRFEKFQKHRAHSYIALVARLYLAWVFITACIHKLRKQLKVMAQQMVDLAKTSSYEEKKE